MTFQEPNPEAVQNSSSETLNTGPHSATEPKSYRKPFNNNTNGLKDTAETEILQISFTVELKISYSLII